MNSRPGGSSSAMLLTLQNNNKISDIEDFFSSPEMEEMSRRNREAFDRAEADGTFARMHAENLHALNSPEMARRNREAFERANANGTFARMRSQNERAMNSPEMEEMARRNRETFERANADGTFARMRSEMHAQTSAMPHPVQAPSSTSTQVNTKKMTVSKRAM